MKPAARPTPMHAAELEFLATADKGKVSALLLAPDAPVAILVLGHGAGANMQHAHMQAIADSLAVNGIATLRFNFPYMQRGGGRTDAMPICAETIDNAVALARARNPDLPLYVGGHSFGGRMASHFAADRRPRIEGLIYYSFPLHPARKPGTGRADHLYRLDYPQLFLSGTRDDLADATLLCDVVSRLPDATLHELETADHGFRILKRTRKSAEDIYAEAARQVVAFISRVSG